MTRPSDGHQQRTIDPPRILMIDDGATTITTLRGSASESARFLGSTWLDGRRVLWFAAENGEVLEAIGSDGTTTHVSGVMGLPNEEGWICLGGGILEGVAYILRWSSTSSHNSSIELNSIKGLDGDTPLNVETALHFDSPHSFPGALYFMSSDRGLAIALAGCVIAVSCASMNGTAGHVIQVALTSAVAYELEGHGGVIPYR